MTDDREFQAEQGAVRAEAPTGVGRTALGVALARAAETARPDRLFADPLAAAFLRAANAGRPEAELEAARRAATAEPSEAWRAMSAHLVLRTAYFDDYLSEAVRDGGCTQVVLLAAGLDTRAFRLDWPAGVRLFELDLPESIAFKEQVLAEQDASPRVERTVLVADLREDWVGALTGAGFDPKAPTAWLVEGLLIYLDAAEAGALLEALGEASAPGSRLSLVGGHGRRGLRELAQGDKMMTPATSLWRGGLGQDQAEWLRRHGWTVEEIGPEPLAARYGAERLAHGGSFLLAERQAEPPAS